MRIVVAIHDRPVWIIPDRYVQQLTAALPGDEVVHVRSQEDRLREMAAADVLFAYRLSRAEYAASAARLQWVHSPAVGVGSLLVPDLVSGRVVVSNSRGLHSEAIAEHAVALALALRRGLHASVRRQVAHEWAQGETAVRCAQPLGRSRLLVIGLGTIGERVAHLGAALGMRVEGVRRHATKAPPPGVELVLPPSSLREALPRADVVVLAVPSTAETRGLIGRTELALLKRSAVVVNIARGDILDQEALAEALAAGRLAGAGLDVFAREPLPPDDRLWDTPNVLITPHIAPFSGDYWPPVVDVFLENLGRFKRGEALRNVVDKRAGY